MDKRVKHTSALSGFYKLGPRERLELVREFAGLSGEEAAVIREPAIGIDQADRLIENVIGVMELPLGVAVNFLINGRDYLIPMVIEEPSVVAAASNAAKLARVKGGFRASSTEPVMIGQIQVVLDDLARAPKAKELIESKETEILTQANAQDPMLVELGGGAKGLEVRVLSDELVVVHILVDCRDAMGANAVNTMAEAVAPTIEEISGGKVYLRILSNLATHRLASAEAVFDKEALGGDDVVEGILKAYRFAEADPYRAATHNKGIMNGIDAVALATGNDFRALEAGAHSYAAFDRDRYGPLTTWERNGDGDLVGRIELPLAVGLIGGMTKVHPTAKANLKILGVKTARELAEVMASVGLAQNLAALRALAAEGIQRGHMGLHARNVAALAGATGKEVEQVAGRMVEEKVIRLDMAKEIIRELREEKKIYKVIKRSGKLRQ